MANYVEINASDWTSEVLKSNMLTVVYFWHESCPWCIRLSPLFSGITEMYRGKIKFVKMNVMVSPENRELASNNGVMGTPTLMFFCQGRSIGQTVSFMTKEQLQKVMDEMLGKHEQCLAQSSDLKNYVV